MHSHIGNNKYVSSVDPNYIWQQSDISTFKCRALRAASMAGVMAGGAGAGDQKVGFWYYGPTVVNMPESHNRTLVGTVSTHFFIG